MSKFAADEVDEWAIRMERIIEPRAAYMLRDLASRIRQEEDDNRRDPVMEPRNGDMIRIEGAALEYRIFVQPGTGIVSEPEPWMAVANRTGATIIRRREVQQ